MSQSDWDVMHSIQNGLITVIDVKVKRNVKLFRKWWAMMRMLCDQVDDGSGGPMFRDKEHASDFILIKTRFCEMYFLPDGTGVVRPDHINWESCSPAKFERIWSAALPVFCDLLKVDEELIEKNLIFYM